jgi:hypothetical protein
MARELFNQCIKFNIAEWCIVSTTTTREDAIQRQQRAKKEKGEHLRHFTHKHGNPQALAGCLAGKQLTPAIGQMPAFTIMLCNLMHQETSAQKPQSVQPSPVRF